MDKENVEWKYTETSLLKKNEILSFVAKWLEPEVSQTEKDRYCHVLPCMWELKFKKPTKPNLSI